MVEADKIKFFCFLSMPVPLFVYKGFTQNQAE